MFLEPFQTTKNFVDTNGCFRLRNILLFNCKRSSKQNLYIEYRRAITTISSSSIVLVAVIIMCCSWFIVIIDIIVVFLLPIIVLFVKIKHFEVIPGLL